MNDNILFCALCSITIESDKFNLKKDYSKCSQRPLILIIESIVGKLPNIHFDICLQCYNLLTELDALEIRHIQIRNQFKKYMVHTKHVSSVQEETYQKNICTLETNVNSLECRNIVESNTTNEVAIINVKSELEDETFKECNTIEEVKSKVENIEKPVSKNNAERKVSGVLKPHICHCSKEFRTANELKNHKASHNDHRAYICEICGQSYKHKSAFNIHMDMHKGINPFTCVFCNKSFTQKGALVRHVPIHTGDMPYQCDKCGKRFIHHTSFNIHRLSHTGHRSYKCTQCGLALMSASHLKRHMRKHTGEKKFSCSTCGKSFAEKYNLAVHEKLHTNTCPNISHKRSYSCQICGVSFEKKVKLDEHVVKDHQMRSHSENNEELSQALMTGGSCTG